MTEQKNYTPLPLKFLKSNPWIPLTIFIIVFFVSLVLLLMVKTGFGLGKNLPLTPTITPPQNSQ